MGLENILRDMSKDIEKPENYLLLAEHYIDINPNLSFLSLYINILFAQKIMINWDNGEYEFTATVYNINFGKNYFTSIFQKNIDHISLFLGYLYFLRKGFFQPRDE